MTKSFHIINIDFTWESCYTLGKKDALFFFWCLVVWYLPLTLTHLYSMIFTMETIMCVRSRFSPVWLFAAPRTAAQQAPLPMAFPGKNAGVGCHFLLQQISLTQGSNACLLHLLPLQADSTLSHLGIIKCQWNKHVIMFLTDVLPFSELLLCARHYNQHCCLSGELIRKTDILGKHF